MHLALSLLRTRPEPLRIRALGFQPLKRGLILALGRDTLRLLAAREGGAMPDIRAMCAIGRRGQLGLNGRMPWEGAKGPDYTADVQRFFELTRGHVILLGPRTYRSVPAFAHDDRTVVAIRSAEQPADVIARFPDRVIYIGGGPPVWTAYAPFIRRWDITRLSYDGAADRWFDPAWIGAG